MFRLLSLLLQRLLILIKLIMFLKVVRSVMKKLLCMMMNCIFAFFVILQFPFLSTYFYFIFRQKTWLPMKRLSFQISVYWNTKILLARRSSSQENQAKAIVLEDLWLVLITSLFASTNNFCQSQRQSCKIFAYWLIFCQ